MTDKTLTVFYRVLGIINTIVLFKDGGIRLFGDQARVLTCDGPVDKLVAFTFDIAFPVRDEIKAFIKDRKDILGVSKRSEKATTFRILVDETLSVNLGINNSSYKNSKGDWKSRDPQVVTIDLIDDLEMPSKAMTEVVDSDWEQETREEKAPAFNATQPPIEDMVS